ncbi:MAG TPA: alpha/beta fold hydrolase [Blastocatellia bacterium]|nr:alpha/beta fold hydrolase [Blastocatellia bacterium]
MAKKQRLLIKRIMWVFIPAVLVFGLGVFLIEAYTTYRLTRPPRTALYGSPHDFQMILQKPIWFDEKWRDADGSQSVGWIMSQGKTAPGIILSHGYGSNRSELLSLSFELWKAGYNVLVYDLRGQGESPVQWSGLGTYEKEDILSAIDYLKGLKTDGGQPLLDGRLGLYGVEMGGYASLLAAAQSTLVKAVAVDSTYTDIPDYLNYRMKLSVGNSSALSRLIDAPVVGNLTNLSVNLYLRRNEEAETAAQAVKVKSDRKTLFIAGADSGALGKMTKDLYAGCAGPKELAVVAKSRLNRLYEKESQDYDVKVVSFFVDALPPVVVDAAQPPEASK